MATATKPVTNGHRLVTLAELLELPLPYEDVTLPEMGGATVRLTAIDGNERARLAGVSSKVSDDSEAQLAFVHEVIAATLPDATSEQVGKLPSSVINQLTPVAMRLAGIGEQAVADAMTALKGTPNAESGSA